MPISHLTPCVLKTLRGTDVPSKVDDTTWVTSFLGSKLMSTITDWFRIDSRPFPLVRINRIGGDTKRTNRRQIGEKESRSVE
ncbi:hypothetical protein OAE79_02020, partial [Rhodopirellula sp.]